MDEVVESHLHQIELHIDKKSWGLYCSLKNIRSFETIVFHCAKFDQEQEDSSKTILELFDSVGELEDKDVWSTAVKLPPLEISSASRFMWRPFTLVELEKAMKRLSGRTSEGIDDFNASIVAKSLPLTMVVLLNILNLSVKCSEVHPYIRMPKQKKLPEYAMKPITLDSGKVVFVEEFKLLGHQKVEDVYDGCICKYNWSFGFIKI
ncbi:hypothetical protein CHUAL_009545 [Chamberlinius hualienensis]